MARYTALIGGIGYGIVHRRTLQKREDTRAEQAAKRHEEKIQADKKREQEQSILAAVRSGGNGGKLRYGRSTEDQIIILTTSSFRPSCSCERSRFSSIRPREIP